MTVNYTGRDFTARYASLLAQFRTLVPELTDMNHSNPGIALIRLLASESDFLSYYADHVFNSGYVDHAQFKQMLVNLGKSIDMLPKLASASTGVITITRGDGVTGDIVIPKYSAFTRTDGISYLTDAAATLESAETSIDIPVTQGALVQLSINIGDFEATDNSRRLRYNLGVNVAAGSATVITTSNSLQWTEVDSYYRTTADDLHYTLELYADSYNGLTDTTFLTLCKKEDDAELPANLTVSFVRCNGANGNTGADTILKPPTALADDITVTNSETTTGGGPSETKEEIRARIPLVARTQRRAVTAEDYQALIWSISGVKYCETVDRNTDPVLPFEYVLLYVTPAGGGTISSQLRQLILAECQNKGHLGSWTGRYIILDSTQNAVDITARVGITNGYSAQPIFLAIRTALQEKYDLAYSASLKIWTFSEIHQTISNIEGVSWVEFSTPIANVTAATGEILTLGTVTLTQGS
jgi:uncharacterized phage protein gp47/JayE